MGPRAFDVGTFLSSLIMIYCAQPGHDSDDGYGDWLLSLIKGTHAAYETELLCLWGDKALHVGCSWPREHFAGEGELAMAQRSNMAELWRDALGFSGVEVSVRTGMRRKLESQIVKQTTYSLST